MTVSQLKATLVLSKYSLLATVRSPTSVVFSLAFPIFFIVIFGSLVGDMGGSIKVAVAPGCDTVNPVYRTVEGLRSIKLVTGLSQEEIGAAMKKGTIGTELKIVNDGAGSGASGLGGFGLVPHYRVTLTGTDSASRAVGLLRPVINATIREMDQRVFPKNPTLAEFAVVRAPGHIHKIIDFVLPGQLGFSLLMAGVFGSSFLLFNLRQGFVLKRLRATPVRKRSIIGGELLSRLFFHVIGYFIMMALGYFVYDFTLVNGWATVAEMLVFSLFGLGIFMGMGFIISGVVQNEHSVTPVANTLTLPQMLLCGLFFPIESYPLWLQHICNVLPLTFFVDGLRSIAFDGLHIWQMPVQVGGLLIWTAVVGVWAVRAFKWE
jgi:ABC-2 type transport system permease protein